MKPPATYVHVMQADYFCATITLASIINYIRFEEYCLRPHHCSFLNFKISAVVILYMTVRTE